MTVSDVVVGYLETSGRGGTDAKIWLAAGDHGFKLSKGKQRGLRRGFIAHSIVYELVNTPHGPRELGNILFIDRGSQA